MPDAMAVEADDPVIVVVSTGKSWPSSLRSGGTPMLVGQCSVGAISTLIVPGQSAGYTSRERISSDLAQNTRVGFGPWVAFSSAFRIRGCGSSNDQLRLIISTSCSRAQSIPCVQVPY